MTSSTSSAREAELAQITGTGEREVHTGRRTTSVYVYEAPVRIWHWVNALAILVLGVTGYFIGSPLPTVAGEASQHFLMGYIRFAHFAAGYVMAIGLVGRMYWGLVGNNHSRELFTVPLFRAAYWREVGVMLKWYAFLIPAPNRYVGHNPLARLMMVVLFMLTALFMVCTGFALYGEGLQAGSWASKFFGWVIPAFGQSQDVHTWHHFGMYGIPCFIILHICAGVREEIMGRTSMLSTMISGHRTFKD